MCHSALVLSLPGFVCLSHFFEFPYAICVEGYLRGRHPLRISCTLKMGTMKARLEVRLDCSVLLVVCTSLSIDMAQVCTEIRIVASE